MQKRWKRKCEPQDWVIIFPYCLAKIPKKYGHFEKQDLGLLGNLPGDEKAVPVIEDTAVDVNDLPAYIRDFNEILKKHDLYSVHYAHAGSGEIHLRPIINLKTEEGNRLFRTIAEEIATLVKKYNGSLSGEHGDGRLRGEFIRQMVGEKNYQVAERDKTTWDPNNIFNPNKIVDTPSMNTMLRYTPGQQTPHSKQFFVFTTRIYCSMPNNAMDPVIAEKHNYLVERCALHLWLHEMKKIPQGQGPIFCREFLTNSEKLNRFDHKEIYEVMDLCLSCKGCKSECPRNVDVAKLKAEFLQHYYDANGVPFRSKLIANFNRSAKLGAIMPGIYNFMMTNPAISKLIKKLSGFAVERSMPTMHQNNFTKSWYKKHIDMELSDMQHQAAKKVYLFCDEFTNYNDTEDRYKSNSVVGKTGI